VSLRARNRQAERIWHLTRQLARELKKDLRLDEEVFLGEAQLSKHLHAEPTPGHRYLGRLLLVRASRGQQQIYDQQRSTYRNFTPTSIQVVMVVRETDALGNLVQETRHIIGGQKNGMTEAAPGEITELLGSISGAELVENANRSLAELLRDEP
jgi:hypothetical protein